MRKTVMKKLIRYWVYFQRGHRSYLAFLISFANFVVIQYRLFVQYVSFLSQIFPHLLHFIAIFIVIYVPVSIVVGWLDYKKVSVPVETTLHVEVNPWNKDLARALYLLAEGKNEEAKKILKKWIH